MDWSGDGLRSERETMHDKFQAKSPIMTEFVMSMPLLQGMCVCGCCVVWAMLGCGVVLSGMMLVLYPCELF